MDLNFSLNKNVIDDIVNYPLTDFKMIKVKKFLTGVIGYVNFLDKNTVLINIENNNYIENKSTDLKKKNLESFFDINTLCVTGINETTKTKPIVNRVLKKDVSRIAHNCCAFKDKTNKKIFAIGGRYERTPIPIKNIKKAKKKQISANAHKNNKGLYLLRCKNVKKGPWNIENKNRPVVREDPLSNFKKTSSYDSQLSCIYSQILQKYILSVRCNIQKGHRYFSILHSDNCLNWSKFYSPKLDPPFTIESNDQVYSVLLHEYLPKKLFLGVCLFYNKEKDIYGTKIFISKDSINWKDLGILFYLPTSRMPRNGYIRPKVQCGGIFSEKNGDISFYFYLYKQRNKLFYFSKTYKFDEIILSN